MAILQADIQLNTGQAVAELNKLSTATKKFGEDLKGSLSQNFSSGVSDIFGKLKTQLLDLASPLAIAGAAVAGLGVAFNKMVEDGSKFQSAIAELSAITGASGDSLDDLGNRARQLAKEFGGSAVDNVTVFKTILSQLGPDIAKNPEALDKMARSVQTLSKATGDDALKSVDALNTSLLQFGVDLSDPMAAAYAMENAMNVMAAGAQVGSSEVPEISAALKVAGVAAKGANVGFTETNAALQALAAGGKKGAEAGTALRNVISKLGEGRFLPKETQKELKEAGVDVLKLGDTTIPLTDRLRELNKITKDTALTNQLFGSENSAAAAILINSTDQIDNFTKAMTGTNTATEQAAIRMATFEEQSARWGAVVNDLFLSAFQKISPILGQVMQIVGNVLTEIGSSIAKVGTFIGEIYKSFQPVVNFFAAIFAGVIVTAFNAVMAVINSVLDVAIKFAKSFGSAIQGITGLFSSLTSSVGGLGGAFGTFQDIVKQSVGVVADFVNILVTGLYQWLGTIIDLIVSAGKSFLEFVGNITGLSDAFSDVAKSGFSLGGVLEYIKVGLIGLRANLAGVIAVLGTFRTLAVEAFNAIKSLNFSALQDIISGAGTKMADSFTSAKNEAYNLNVEQQKNLTAAEQLKKIEEQIATLKASASLLSSKEFAEKKKALLDEIAQKKAANALTVEEETRLQKKIAEIGKTVNPPIDKEKAEKKKKAKDTEAAYEKEIDKEIAKARAGLLKAQNDIDEAAENDKFKRRLEKVKGNEQEELAKIEVQLSKIKGNNKKELELRELLEKEKTLISEKSFLDQLQILKEQSDAEDELYNKKKEAQSKLNELTKEYVSKEGQSLADLNAEKLKQFDFETEEKKAALDKQLKDLLKYEKDAEKVQSTKAKAFEKLESERADARRKIQEESAKAELELVAQTLGQGAALFKENTVAYKLLAIAQATISTYLAATKALASAPPPFNFIQAALVTATGLANVVKISGIGFRKGGFTGSGGLDDAAGIVHKGEFVSDATTTRRERGLLEFLHKGGTSSEFIALNMSKYSIADSNTPLVDELRGLRKEVRTQRLVKIDNKATLKVEHDGGRLIKNVEIMTRKRRVAF